MIMLPSGELLIGAIKNILAFKENRFISLCHNFFFHITNVCLTEILISLWCLVRSMNL